MWENDELPIHLRTDADQSIIVEQNNIEGGYGGNDNYDLPPTFIDDEIHGTIQNSRFDESQFLTIIIPNQPIPSYEELTGRVFRCGDFWSVVKIVERKKIIVWGECLPNECEFQIISSYQRE